MDLFIWFSLTFTPSFIVTIFVRQISTSQAYVFQFISNNVLTFETLVEKNLEFSILENGLFYRSC